ncbi:MAG: diacylglycerol kinase family protein [Segetibacter sp.]|nr:diacylglycerol kinase family protein [Segetibacter sp.]
MLNFLKAFAYAFNGLVIFFRHERNGRIQLLIAVVVVLLAWWLGISATEWMVVLGCIAIVLSFEMINSSIEKLCNLVHPKYHPAVKTIKDMSAGAVLFVAVLSAIIGAIIFIPKILPYL